MNKSVVYKHGFYDVPVTDYTPLEQSDVHRRKLPVLRASTLHERKLTRTEHKNTPRREQIPRLTRLKSSAEIMLDESSRVTHSKSIINESKQQETFKHNLSLP